MAKTPVSDSTVVVAPKTRKARELTPEGAARLEASRGKDRVPVLEFVNVWCNSATILEVATKLNLSTQAVIARSKTLRKAGTRLPERPLGTVRGAGGRGRVGYSAATIEELNAIIAAANAGTLGLDAEGKLTTQAPAQDVGNDVEAEGSEDESEDIL